MVINLTGRQVGKALRFLRPGADFQVIAYPHRLDGDEMVPFSVIWKDTEQIKPTDQEIEDGWVAHELAKDQRESEENEKDQSRGNALTALRALDPDNLDVSQGGVRQVLKDLIKLLT